MKKCSLLKFFRTHIRQTCLSMLFQSSRSKDDKISYIIVSTFVNSILWQVYIVSWHIFLILECNFTTYVSLLKIQRDRTICLTIKRLSTKSLPGFPIGMVGSTPTNDRHVSFTHITPHHTATSTMSTFYERSLLKYSQCFQKDVTHAKIHTKWRLIDQKWQILHRFQRFHLLEGDFKCLSIWTFSKLLPLYPKWVTVIAFISHDCLPKAISLAVNVAVIFFHNYLRGLYPSPHLHRNQHSRYSVFHQTSQECFFPQNFV